MKKKRFEKHIVIVSMENGKEYEVSYDDRNVFEKDMKFLQEYTQWFKIKLIYPTEKQKR